MVPKNFKIDQRYTVEKNLGDGLSGEVLLVSDDTGLKALKFLKKIQLNVSREEALSNFKNEFSILKELNHPNIGRILDFGFDPKVKKYYFTTEFIDGGELQDFYEGSSLEDKERFIVQVLRALNYLHSRGIYHFDIKPQNILVSKEEGVAKIIDFGLAGFESPGKKVGTPIYMAPEVIKGGRLDGRTDLYSTGVMIYAMLTGENPFRGKSFKEISDKQLELVPEPASQVNPDVPAYWDHILARLLEKDPANRYSQASLVIRDLNFLSDKHFEIETKDTKVSYLPEKGTLIGRDKQWNEFTRVFEQAFGEEASSTAERLLIVQGKKGTGKTRLLSEMKYHSQLNNVPVKSLQQYRQEEERAEQFILQIDTPEVSINQVNALLSENLDRKVLLVWAVEEAPQNVSGSVNLTLENYSKSELKGYLESVTGLSHAPSSLIEEIFKRTQGNPLFVAEFIKSLLDQNLLYDDSGQWDATTFEDIKIDFSQIHIPDSVEESLKNRFAALPESQAEILRWIAVNHGPLGYSDLMKLVDSDHLQEELNELVLGDFIETHMTDLSYGFKNLVFQSVIYNSIVERKRKDYHDELAKTFAGRDDKRRLHCYHLGYGSDTAAAKIALDELAKIHLQEADYDQAVAAYARYLDIARAQFANYDAEVFFKVGGLYTLMRRYPEAKAIYEELLKYWAEESADNRIRVYAKLVDIHNKQDQGEDVLKLCDEAAPLIPQTKDEQMHEMIFENFKTHVLFKSGETDKAREQFIKSREAWKNQLSDEQRQRVTNNRLIEIYYLNAETDDAIKFCEENIRALKGSEEKYDLALNYYALGDLYYRKSFTVTEENKAVKIGECLRECRENFEACETISKETYHYSLLLRAYNGLGNIAHFEQKMDEALDYYRRTLSIAQKINELESAANTALNIANIYITQGNFKESYSYLIYAINTFDHLPRISQQSELNFYFSYLSVSEVYCEWGKIDKAHTAIDRAAEIFEKNASVQRHEYWMIIRKALVHFAEGAFDQAKELTEKAKGLAQNDEEKADLEAALKVLQFDFAKARKAEGGVRVMTTNLSNTSSQDELSKIIEINQIMNTEYDFPQLLKIVMNYAVQLTKAEGGAILLLNEEGEFQVAESMNLSDAEREGISMSIARQALETGEIVESSDAAADERFDGSQSIVVNELQSVLCLPVRSKNKPVGVFYLDNRYQKNAFEGTNVTLLTAFCDQVGMALENAKLISDLKSAQGQLENKLVETQAQLEEVKGILHEEVGNYKTKYGYKNIISKSKMMHDIFKLLDKIMNTNLAVFVFGESGTGKELIAKALHYNNEQRAKGRFVAINCGAIPSNLMESELFGHKAGSFTGAVRDKKGMFEEANGGTLFLDEIGELPLELQVKLLRVLQEGEIQRIGDHRTIKVDVRVISASHQDIEGMVKEAKFREDLFYRLCQMRIDIPALKERKEDIPDLVKHFVKKYTKENNLEKSPEVPSEFLKAMLNYDWPGNIRELENLVSVACALEEGGALSFENLPDHYGIKNRTVQITQGFAGQNTSVSLPLENAAPTPEISDVVVEGQNHYDPNKTWKEYEALVIAKAYQQAGFKKKQTSQWLGVSHSTIYKKIEDYNLDDKNNPVYGSLFRYNEEMTLKNYVEKVFLAALKHFDDHPYAAIKVLEVSQGYFYKVIKGKRHLIHEERA